MAKDDKISLDSSALKKIVRDQVSKEMAESAYSASPEYAQDLRDVLERFTTPPRRFERGDLVRWKPGLQNKTFPHEGAPGIVVEHLEKSLDLTERDSGSQYYREPLDLMVASIAGEERQFAVFHYDSRRFEIFEDSDHAEDG